MSTLTQQITRLRRAFVSLLTLVLFSTLPTAAQPRAAEQQFLLHLPGVAGECRVDHSLLRGLAAGGLMARVHIHDWTGNDRGLKALLRYEQNRAEAAKVAQLLIEQFRARPDSRIVLTAHSGGAGLAIWALEQLPEDVRVDELYLLAPALSPTYDLSRALSRVKGKAFALTSEHDQAILGLGTRLFGTIDRVKTDAAGRVGFVQPDGADPAQYVKLIQIPYDPAWMSLGNIGDHIGVMSSQFARSYLAPLMLTGMPPVIAPPTTAPAIEPAR